MIRKIILIFALICFVIFSSFAQSVWGTSNSLKLSIDPKYEFTAPPILYVDMQFSDDNGNGVIEAEEKAVLKVRIMNKGNGPAQGLKVRLNSNVHDTNFQYPRDFAIDKIMPGESEEIIINMTASLNVKSNEHNIEISVSEHFGYDMDPANLILNTLEYQKPEIVFSGLDIFDKGEGTTSIIEDGQLQAGEMVKTKLVIQNIGNNIAFGAEYRIYSTDSNIMILDGSGEIGDMAIGEVKEIWVTLTPNRRVSYDDHLPIFLTVNEKVGKGSLKNYQLPLSLNQRPPQTETLTVTADFEKMKQQVARFEYKSDRYTSKIAVRSVDAVPIANTTREDAVAIVIGVERYDNIAPAPYAAKDAEVMTRYFKDVLGIKHVETYTNEQVGGFFFMKTFDPNTGQLRKMVNKGETDVFIYYSGHGIPEKDGKEVYLFPYDGKIEMLDVMGYSLNKLYKNLEDLEAKSITVILDACFSGSSRTSSIHIAENLSGTKGVRIRPREVQPWENNPNFRVFASSEDEQTSLGLDEAGTGLFTYYIALGLQGDADLDADGIITANELNKYVTDKVSETSERIRGKQTPQFFGNDDFILVEF